jgi:hypothetical protein
MTRAVKITKNLKNHWWVSHRKLNWRRRERWGKTWRDEVTPTPSKSSAHSKRRLEQHTGDTFPSHSLLVIELSRIIQTRSQWFPWENLPDLKVFSLRHVKFFLTAFSGVFCKTLINNDQKILGFSRVCHIKCLLFYDLAMVSNLRPTTSATSFLVGTITFKQLGWKVQITLYKLNTATYLRSLVLDHL